MLITISKNKTELHYYMLLHVILNAIPVVCWLQPEKFKSYQQMWLSLSPPPQKIILDLTGLIERPYLFRCFGFDCWHDYPTNPARIKLAWG